MDLLGMSIKFHLIASKFPVYRTISRVPPPKIRFATSGPPQRKLSTGISELSTGISGPGFGISGLSTGISGPRLASQRLIHGHFGTHSK